MADFKFRDEGSIFLIGPTSPDGMAWCDEHLPDDCPTFGPYYAIEHRYAADILDGMAGDGLEGEAA